MSMGSLNKLITGGRPHCTHITNRNEVGHQILKQVPYHSQSQFSVLVGWIISKKNHGNCVTQPVASAGYDLTAAHQPNTYH